MKNLTIFVEEYNEDGNLKGIYIKEKLKDDENKIIIANKGKLIKNDEMDLILNYLMEKLLI